MELHLPIWDAHSHIVAQAVNNQGIKVDSIWIDGIAGASVAFTTALTFNVVTARWDFTDSLNVKVTPGKYLFCAEIANIDKNGKSTDVPAPMAHPFSESSCGIFTYGGTNTSAVAALTVHMIGLTATAE